jgi:hypothetical protein
MREVAKFSLALLFPQSHAFDNGALTRRKASAGLQQESDVDDPSNPAALLFWGGAAGTRLS